MPSKLVNSKSEVNIKKLYRMHKPRYLYGSVHHAIYGDMGTTTSSIYPESTVASCVGDTGRKLIRSIMATSGTSGLFGDTDSIMFPYDMYDGGLYNRNNVNTTSKNDKQNKTFLSKKNLYNNNRNNNFTKIKNKYTNEVLRHKHK
ncbi:Partial DNA polymerase type-B (Palm domain) [Orpheovirus IHUMI-LCC2]|uniref:Partial DNA polymerase type-B (Palm domain) n=1 Tax=Orpheovirus IHUMI-LCC2 TaxID=2023057 RepID=A0A2I2L492_9VIRU|nr:Partial DNA polymerase type-B (Palm domain) [Orpheovirus IHUMI-LCC2]SNW62331.1 Partial DNA polymerase type-B (Palm domain) [Orpheovirus IHUMI-LCC2]